MNKRKPIFTVSMALVSIQAMCSATEMVREEMEAQKRLEAEKASTTKEVVQNEQNKIS